MSDAAIQPLVSRLERIASDAPAYAAAWKSRTGRKALAVLPMNFPVELVDAAGGLPVLLQQDDDPITEGRKLIYEFYCAYSRSLADQAAKRRLDPFDGFLAVDHCVALLGALDAMRFEIEDRPVFLAQFPASMDEASTRVAVRERIAELRAEIGRICSHEIADADLVAAIEVRDRQRQAIRAIMTARREGRIDITARQMRAIVQSAMVMDPAEHLAVLDDLAALLPHQPPAERRVRLYLSGHYCHAPAPALLDMIEGCGVTVADDDLFTGYRYVSTDVGSTVEPAEAVVEWYFARNVAAPCATRAQRDVDGETFLLDAIEASNAAGVIILMAKFCEPHMLYFPEVRKALLARDIPHLVIETEHEGLALEMLKTRVEALIETMKTRGPVPQLPAATR